MPRAWRIRNALAEILPRRLAVALGIRRLSPGRRWPVGLSVNVAPASDTGGAYRAKHRRQDPAADPTEPYGGESSSTGTDHGWSGCTMSAGADAIAYQLPRGSVTPWGGDLRHRQSDLSGGTDLYDLRTAWAEYGETLTIRSGSGWSAVVKAHDEGRAVVVQGEGNVPGSETFDGGHACAIAPETHADGRWLFGDPLASDWQWCTSSSIRSWMESLSSGCYFATGDKPADEPAPAPPPAPVPTYADGLAAGRVEGYQAGHAHGELVGDAERADLVFRSWDPGRPFEPEGDAGGRWDLVTWASSAYDPGAAWASGVLGGVWDLDTWAGEVVDGAPWAAWPLPLEAVYRAQWLAAWNGSAAWAGALWRD